MPKSARCTTIFAAHALSTTEVPVEVAAGRANRKPLVFRAAHRFVLSTLAAILHPRGSSRVGHRSAPGHSLAVTVALLCPEEVHRTPMPFVWMHAQPGFLGNV